MPTRPFFGGCLLVVSVFVLGCGDSAAPTTVADLSEPRFNFINGPSTANVFRHEEQILVDIFDPETDLLVEAGLPADPSDAFFCGGGSGFDLMPIQNAGLLQDAINVLILGRDIHIHVYNVTTPGGICDELPIAQGMGNVTLNDNDSPIAGPGANSFGWRIQGTLDDLVNGGKVRVAGVARFLILPDESFKVDRTSVRLHRIGKK